jgi:prepilin-type N-terminal cleavage/methylation domain-containing protein
MKLPFTIYGLRFTICRKSVEFSAFNHQSSIVNHKFRRAFTLIELLVVLAILGIMAGLAVPALKNFGHADAMVAATQQMVGDVGRARQLAISQRTTVYMVFVPTTFWIDVGSGTLNTPWLNSLGSAQQIATNLCDKQLTGYTFATYGAVGDQPGQHQWHYLAPWQTLPDGTFIPLQKFTGGITIVDPATRATYPVFSFNYTNDIPFPTETNTTANTPNLPWLPYIAFNYLGQLTFDGQTMADRHEYIPLAKGSVLLAIDPATRTFQLNSPQVSEVLPGNSTNAYNIIDIDPLTGRATLQQPKLQ